MSDERKSMVVGREIATESAGRPGRWDYQRRAATNVRATTRIGPRITATRQARSMTGRIMM
jgi:hypothetical protein